MVCTLIALCMKTETVDGSNPQNRPVVQIGVREETLVTFLSGTPALPQIYLFLQFSATFASPGILPCSPSTTCLPGLQGKPL